LAVEVELLGIITILLQLVLEVAVVVPQALVVLVIQIMGVEKQLELQVKVLLAVLVQVIGMLVEVVELAVLVLTDLPMEVLVLNIQPLALSFGVVVEAAPVTPALAVTEVLVVVVEVQPH
jgi:hypothetical protein